MKQYKFITLFFLLISISFYAQTNVSKVLEVIQENNTGIQAHKEWISAQKIQNKTGISLYNPAIEYDYMMGSPNEAGNQTDIVVSQSFDFPTVYGKRKSLASKQNEQLNLVQNKNIQDVLLEAKLICTELIYRNKLHTFLTSRKQDTENWKNNFQKKMDTGEGTILDVNKAEIQLIEINKSYWINQSEINALNQKLTQLNGGKSISLSDTIYSEIIDLPDFETLYQAYQANDYNLQTLQQENDINEKKIEISKALALPKLEVGYRYQGVLDQTFNGFRAGITLPLWENKNTVKLQKANSIVSEANLTNYIITAENELKLLYNKYIALKGVVQAYRQSEYQTNNIKLLDKALQYGKISTLEYFVELNYFNNSVLSYLETEKELYTTITQLLKYQL